MLKKILILLFLFLMAGTSLAQLTPEQQAKFDAWERMVKPKTLDVEKSILTALTGGIAGLDSWGVTELELGLDWGFISKVIFKVNRSVERNFKPTGPMDQYLVKDVLKIGFRLGYGMGISGDVSYVRQYTVVYPVRTKREGSWHNKFFLNLFLPYHVHKGKVPKRHVIIVEDFLEGRGRLQLGGTASIPIGVEGTVSLIKLNRAFVHRTKENKAIIYKDVAYSNKWAMEAFLHLIYFDVPVLNLHLEGGKLKRDYIELDMSDEATNPLKGQAVRLALLQYTLGPARELGKHKYLNDKFKENYRELSFFGLRRNTTLNRIDHYTEMEEREGGVFNLVERVQITHNNFRSWTFPFTGERHYKSVLLVGRPGDEGEVKDPYIRMTFRVLDYRTKQKELKEGYLPFVNGIAMDPTFIDFDPELEKKRAHWGEVNILTEIKLGKEAITKLLNTPDQEYWKSLSFVVNEPQLQDEKFRKKIRWKPFKSRKYRKAYKKLRDYLKELKESRAEKKPIEKMKALARALRQTVYKKGMTFKPQLLATLKMVLGRDLFRYEASVNIHRKKKMFVKEGSIMQNRLGILPEQKDPFYLFTFNDAHQLFHLFD